MWRCGFKRTKQWARRRRSPPPGRTPMPSAQPRPEWKCTGMTEKVARMAEPNFVPLATYREYPVEEMKDRAAEFEAEIRRRRTVREFSERPVPREIIEDCLRAAGTAPNAANPHPWHFVVVGDSALKTKIREAAEKEGCEV